MRLEVREQSLVGNQHVNILCPPARGIPVSTTISQGHSSVSTQAHTLARRTSEQADFVCWGANNLDTGKKETCPQCQDSAFSQLDEGKGKDKPSPRSTSPSLLPDPCCRTASKEQLGPVEVKESTCPDMCSPQLSSFSPTADPYQPWRWQGSEKKGQHPDIFLALSSVYSVYLTLGEVSCVLWVQTAYSVEVLSTNQNTRFGF